MSRIAANLSGIERTLIDRMNAANAAVATSTLRLATMQKINSASDAPSAFVSLSRFQSQLTNVTAAMTNASAASSMLSQAESTVSQIQDQLDIIRDALLTPTDSSQETIDTALARINELANTEINGRRVLDGSASFRTAGVDPNQVARLTVSATQGGTRQIEGEVLTAGTQATLRYTGSGGLATADATIIITGNLGSAQITVTNGETLTNLADAINAVSYETGVTAAVDGDNLDLTSVSYGDDALVSVAVPNGTFTVTGGDGNGTDYGTSGTAVINGEIYTASAADGNRYTVSDNGLRFQITFKPGFTGEAHTIQVSGSALSFALSPNVSQPSAISIPSMLTANLGGDAGNLSQIGSGGDYADLGDNRSQALLIVDEAIAQVATIQGNIAGFSLASVSSASTLLTDLQEDIQTSIDSIDLVNVAEETVQIQYYTALADNAISGLAIINQQRSAIVSLIKQIAGLE
jgi:flagellin-like hook-associated protein FlgL